MTYPEQLVELIEEFQDVDDQMERLEMVFEMADEVVSLPVEAWSDTTRILGCQSEAHVAVNLDQGKVLMSGGADSQLVQGLSTEVPPHKPCSYRLNLPKKWAFLIRCHRADPMDLETCSIR
jgi:sulfur transfer protein SufE